MSAPSGAAQSYKLLHSFETLPSSPQAALLLAADGSFYGTSQYGGKYGLGSIFVLTPDGRGGSTFSTFYSFHGDDGANPTSTLIQDKDGLLYGTTTRGGAVGGGTVFRINTARQLTTLHALNSSGSPGSYVPGIVDGKDGFFYGTTPSGTLYRIDASGTYTVLNTLMGQPQASLVRASDGNFYGTTFTGGADGTGTVFRMDHNGLVTTLHNFGQNEGHFPMAALIQGRDGFLYGTTVLGGAGDIGTVFRMDFSGSVTVLHSFDGSDGSNPSAALVEDGEGNFFGTTFGGVTSYGSIFRIDASGKFTVLHTFSYTDGGRSQAPLIQAPTGAFYGTTSTGGRNDKGTVFTSDGSGNLTTLRNLGGFEAAAPFSALLRASDGFFYGVDCEGGTYSSGSIFRVDSSGIVTTLYSFTAYSVGSSPDGACPRGALIQAANGNFYGTTYAGGTTGIGTVFQMDGQGLVTILHSFNGQDGARPLGSLLQATDGHFYGTTSEGGGALDTGHGTAFKIDAAGNLTTLHFFYVTADFPHAGLIQSTDGNFYGTTYGGGASGFGTVFKMDPQGNVSVLHSFSSENEGEPEAPLIQAADGKFYGTTTGGLSGLGTIFRMDSSGNFTTLHAFDLFNDGANPQAGLIQAADGNFYGTAPNGGANSGGAGTIFRVDAAGKFTVVRAFGGSASYGDGGNPQASLVQGADERLYGTASMSAATGLGGVFSLGLSLSKPATHFSVIAPPTATTGEPSSVTVTALDDSNQIAADYYRTVQLESSDGNAGLSAPYTFTPVDAGVHTFANGIDLNGQWISAGSVFQTPGLQTVTASDQAVPGLAGTSGPISVTRPTWVLSIASLTNAGAVVSSPPGISCGGTCSASFNDGVEIALNASVDPGFALTGWAGDPDCADARVTMNANKICVAIFDLVPLPPKKPSRAPRQIGPR